MREGLSLEEYKRRLAQKVRKGEIVCPRCGNREDFMVNVLGHVFCNRCYEKIRLIDWGKG
ncbi:MAG: hypothetical protein ACTSUS_05220 [Candidatus Freyarchaeota archaeon]